MAMLNKSHQRRWGARKVYEPNTIIGGMGGSIGSKQNLASKLNIPENSILFSRNVGGDVHAYIEQEYVIPEECFKGNNIKTFLDYEGKAIGMKEEAFMLTRKLEEILVPNMKELGRDCFRDSRVPVLDLSSLPINPKLYGEGVGDMFGRNPEMVYLNTGEAAYWIRDDNNEREDGLNVYGNNNHDLEIYSKIEKYGRQDFSGTRIHTYENEYVTHFTFESFRGSGSVKVVLPNLLYFGERSFYRPSDEVGKLEEIIAPKCKEIEYYTFQGANIDIKLLDIRGCTTMHIDAFGHRFGTQPATFQPGAIMKVHENIKNFSEVLRCKNKGAIIEVYDDDGNYIETL